MFKVTVIERMNVCGGQATSIPLNKEMFGTDWLNDGVQGGSPVSSPYKPRLDLLMELADL